MDTTARLHRGARLLLSAMLIVGVLLAGAPQAQGQLQTPGAPTPRPGVDRIQPAPDAPTAVAPRAPRRATPSSGAAIVRGATGGGVRVQGPGQFDPTRRIPIVYGEVPDEGEAFTVQGPMAVGQFLNEWIHPLTNWNILPTPEAQGVMLQFWITNMRPKEALQILRFHNVYYTYEPDSNFLYVMTEDQYLEQAYDNLAQSQLRIQHVELADIEAVIGSLMSDAGRYITDARTARIYVFDRPENLEEIVRIVDEIDVPVATQSFRLRHINADTVLDSLEAALSEQGLVRVDPRSNTLVVTDVPERLARAAAVIQDLDIELETRSWLINYSDVDEIAGLVAVLIPPEMGEIVTNPQTHQLTITAIPERLAKVDELIRTWDIARRQVHIEAYLVTTTSTMARNLGINWAYFDTIRGTPFSLWQGAPSGNLTAGPSVGDRFAIGALPAPDYFTDAAGNPILDINNNPILRGWLGNDIAATLSYLDSLNEVTILSQGRVTVQDGEEALFENTSRVPYAASFTTETSATVDRIRTDTQFVDVGTILRVLPRVSDHDNILMEVSAEDSTYTMVTFQSGGETNSAPEKRQNRAQTIVMVNNEQTLVIGGLRQSNRSDFEEKFPLLGDLPIIGRAFKTTNRAHNHNDLLIFITCTIVGPDTSPEALRLAQQDARLADAFRSDQKPDWQRWLHQATRGVTERSVSIGQSGDIYADGELTTVPALQERFAEIQVPEAISVIIRNHPRAPEEVVNAVAEAAEDAGLRVTYDNTTPAFVPARR